jgi:hypothetical protein
MAIAFMTSDSSSLLTTEAVRHSAPFLHEVYEWSGTE